jgi:hypothetical protein
MTKKEYVACKAVWFSGVGVPDELECRPRLRVLRDMNFFFSTCQVAAKALQSMQKGIFS